MSENVNKQMRAARAFNTLCAAMAARKWKYDKFDKDLTVSLSFKGESFPINLVLRIHADQQLISLYSPLTFSFPEDKRVEGALATLAGSYGLTNGSFDYDASTGKVLLRIVTCFHSSELSQAAVLHMVDMACAVLDRRTDKFFAISKGYLSISDYLAEVYN